MAGVPLPSRIYVARVQAIGSHVVYTVPVATKLDLRFLSLRGSSPGTTWTASVFIEPSLFAGEDVFQVTAAVDYSSQWAMGKWILQPGDAVGVNFSQGSGLDVWLSGVLSSAVL